MRNLTADWIGGKIKSAIAEFACREHLAACGYTVEPLGIEHVAPAYLALHNAHAHDLPAFCREELNKFPDFIASRRAGEQVQVLLVEVKYRTRVDLTEFDEALYHRYGYLTERGADLMFYMVAREAHTAGTSVPGHVFVNCSWARGWRSPEVAASDPRLGAPFASTYAESILPALEGIWREPTRNDDSSIESWRTEVGVKNK